MNKGIWQSPAGAVEVAVKTLQSSASQEDRVKFLQEAAINGQFRHPNVVKLLGVVTVGEPVSINNPLFVCTWKHFTLVHSETECAVTLSKATRIFLATDSMCIRAVYNQKHTVGHDCVGAVDKWRPQKLPH